MAASAGRPATREEDGTRECNLSIRDARDLRSAILAHGRLMLTRTAPVLLFMLAVLSAHMAHGAVPAYKVGIEVPANLAIEPYYESSLREMGINYINYYVVTSQYRLPGDADLRPESVNRAMMSLADRLGADFSISCHAVDPTDQSVHDAVAHGKANGRFRGVVFDEVEHIRLLWNYSPTPLADFGKWRTLDEAYEGTLDGYRKLKSKFDGLGSPAVTATHIWPVLEHAAARAGWIVCPKICKELYSPVSLAIGMGAAKEYGRELWTDVDLWYYALVPGHTAEEMKSNLLLAYWLGSDLTYIEGAGHSMHRAGKQGPPFSLVNRIAADTYQLTPHGEALRWFCKEYLPAHPRPWTFRDIRPSIAVIHFDDTCHGQRYVTTFPDNLYGSPNLHSDADTEAWLGLWNLLTFGKTGRDGLTYFKVPVASGGYQRDFPKGVYMDYASHPIAADMHTFFVPLNGVVVYDDLVGYDLLEDIPLLFVSGKRVSKRTMAAIHRCVRSGAVCVIWGPLAKANGFGCWESGVKVVKEGKGRFVITGDFQYSQIYGEVTPLLGRPDEISYVFGRNRVTLKRVTDNEVTVEVRKVK